MSASFFQRPLGIALSGGGALGSWQSAALLALENAGLSFNAATGFSAGALNAGFYFLSRTGETIERWRQTDPSVLRFSPRFSPFSIFDGGSIRSHLEGVDDDLARKKGRCKLVVITARPDRSKPLYAVYDPAGDGAWDAPLADHMTASCSIPIVFPPVTLDYRGQRLSLIDGGIPCAEPLSFRPLGPCKDVIVLEMIRADEMSRRPWGPIASFHAKVRRNTRNLMNQGVASLISLPDPPRVFRLAPSQVLDFSMLDFKKSNTGPALELGARDAEAFLKDPEAHLV